MTDGRYRAERLARKRAAIKSRRRAPGASYMTRLEARPHVEDADMRCTLCGVFNPLDQNCPGPTRPVCEENKER